MVVLPRLNTIWSLSAWWRHQMKIFSALLAICAGNSPVPGEFPTQGPVTRSFEVFFDLRPNKQDNIDNKCSILRKQWVSFGSVECFLDKFSLQVNLSIW